MYGSLFLSSLALAGAEFDSGPRIGLKNPSLRPTLHMLERLNGWDANKFSDEVLSKDGRRGVVE